MSITSIESIARAARAEAEQADREDRNTAPQEYTDPAAQAAFEQAFYAALQDLRGETEQ